jgi:hypothetical protein
MPISAKSPPRLTGVSGPVAALVRAALAEEGRRPGELGIVLTGDAPVRELTGAGAASIAPPTSSRSPTTPPAAGS